MSIRRMMLFTLGGFFKSIISIFKTRVLSSGGNFEAETNLETQLNVLGSDLFNSTSLIITPNAYKEAVLFSATPSSVGNNLLVRSSEFENSAWTKNLLSISSTRSTAPNALLEARTVQTPVDTAANRHRLSQSLNAFINTNTPYTFSIYAKKNQHRWIQLNFVVGFDLNNWANFDLEEGIIGNKGTGAIGTIENVGNGWYRLSIVGNPIEGQPNYNAEVITTGNINSGRYPSYQSTAAENVFDIWGAQVEIGTIAGPYIPTVNKQAINETICDFTTTRATTATRVNEQGLVELVPYNLFSYSEDFSNSYWTKQNTTIINNSIAAPNGTMTADKIVGNSGVTYKYTTSLGVNVASSGFVINSTERVVSFYLKYGGLNRIRVIYGASTNLSVGIYVEVDLQLGIITGTYGGSFASNFFIEDAGDGWYRVGFTVIITIQSTNNRFGIGLGDTTKTVGDGVDGVYVWGAQLVDGSSNKSYQLTTNRLNVPRIDYTTGQPAILVEPQRTNLFLQSEDFTNGWTQEGTSVLSNTQIAPNGLLTADSIFELATNNIHSTYRSAITVTANQLYSASFFVKKNNVRWVRVVLTQNGSTTIWAGAQFDLDTKTFTSQVGIDEGVFSSASITSLVNGWYRINVIGSIPGTGMIPMLVLSNGDPMLNTDTRGCPVYLGNVNNELYVWGGQLELGSNTTSYIPTTTTTVTRNADVISNTNAYNLIGQTEGTILIKGSQFNRGIVFRIRNNTNISVNRLWIFCIATNGRVEVGVMKDGVTVSTAAVTPVNGVNEKNIIMIYSQNIFKVFISGQLIYEYNYPTPTDFTTVLNTVEFGSLSEMGTANFDFISLWKTQLTDQQAIQLTTL